MQKLTCPKCSGSGKIDDPRAVGQALRDKREAAGKSLREVAAFMKVTAAFLSDCELGHRRLTDDRISDFNAALNHKSKPSKK